MHVKLGSLVQDEVTKFEGIAVCRTEWLKGCARIGVQSQELKDGKPIDIHYVDEAQLVVLREGVVPQWVHGFLVDEAPGGPRQDDMRNDLNIPDHSGIGGRRSTLLDPALTA